MNEKWAERRKEGRNEGRKEGTAGKVKTREKERSSPLNKKNSEGTGSRSQKAGIR